MPMLASMCTRIPPTPKERSSAARRRRPVALAEASSPGASTTANSSPPRRDSESPSRSADLQPRADLAQHLVAGVVAERVVELLEAVEVDQQQRDLGVGVLDRLAEPRQQVAAVAEPGQVVGDRGPLALAQAVDDRQSGPGHSGQDGDRRQRRGDRREADELADDEQRQRRRHVDQDRRQHDRVERAVGPRLGLVDPGRGDERDDGQGRGAPRARRGRRARARARG